MRFALIQTVALLISVGFVVSCQDYGFEEVPSSVVREKRFTQTISASTEVDILFVVDNSRSMVGEQTAIGESFSNFSDVLDEKFGPGKYRIAVITTGMTRNTVTDETSNACLPCPVDNPELYSCINETGENGRFQDRIGKNTGTPDAPVYVFETNQECRVISSDNKSCFYDKNQRKGTIFVGVRGCGYERGLAPIKSALSKPLIDSYNADFLRDNATLAVVVISDEEDCGEVGDISEETGYSARVCYYAAKGVDHLGALNDPGGKPYQLTPISEYYDFLVGLKKGRKELVKFAAIIGVEDIDNPSTTEIEYQDEKIRSSCATPNCSGIYCSAQPGTRYIQLAQLFGDNGLVTTICQDDFSETMTELGSFVACPRQFSLSEEILDPGLANILINDKEVPTYTCDTEDSIQVCQGPSDASCPAGSGCLRTWTYIEPGPNPDPKALGGKIIFSVHYNPCDFLTDTIRIELVYATE